MTVRYATAGDLPRMTEIMAAAFNEDPITMILHPYAAEHPADWLDANHYMLQGLLHTPNSLLLVCEADDPAKDGSPQIAAVMGMVLISKNYKNPRHLPLAKDSIQERFARQVAQVRETVYRKFFTPQSKERAEFAAAGREPVNIVMRKHFTDADDEQIPRWWINILGTDPAMRRKGYAARLVEWCLEQADEDGLLVGVNSSPHGRALYEKYGFEPVEDTIFGPDAVVGRTYRRTPR